jgi:cathepsin L
MLLSVVAAALPRSFTGDDVIPDEKQRLRVLFDEFVTHHGRSYESSEYEKRLQIFAQRRADIEAQNMRQSRLWSAGVNHFTDLTDEELSVYRGRKGPRGMSQFGSGTRNSFIQKHTSDDIPVSPQSLTASEVQTVAWTNLSISKKIPDQKACGSCWALTTIATLEANYEIHTTEGKDKPLSFSAQELVSCVANPRHCGGTGGCDGATVELGMEYIKNNGINQASTVPYEGRNMKCTCKAKGSPEGPGQSPGGGPGQSSFIGLESGHNTMNSLTGWRTLKSNDMNELVQAVTEVGPVAVSVAASDWHMYQKGIFDKCDKNCIVDHAVTLYGIGEEGGHKYWLIRNSWGPSWGEKGFIRVLLRQNEGQFCGIDNDAQKGIACDGDPSSVTVCGTCGILYDSVVPCFENTASSICKSQSQAQPQTQTQPQAQPKAKAQVEPKPLGASGGDTKSLSEDPGVGRTVLQEKGPAAGSGGSGFNLAVDAPVEVFTERSKMIRREEPPF